jgi:predicted transcriptional regulator
MKILIELDDDDGDLLDRLAEEQDRSRSAQARRMLLRAIREATGQTIIKEDEDQ